MFYYVRMSVVAQKGSLVTGDLARLRGLLGALAPADDDAERIDRVRLLEELKGAIAAAQAVETARSQLRSGAHSVVPAYRPNASGGALLRRSRWRAASRRFGPSGTPVGARS